MYRSAEGILEAAKPFLAETPAKTPKPKKERVRTGQTKLKFSFKEQREYATIDEDIASLEAQIEALFGEGACYVLSIRPFGGTEV